MTTFIVLCMQETGLTPESIMKGYILYEGEKA